MASENDMEDGKNSEVARVLSAASEQIGLALKDSQPSVEALGESLGRLAEFLAGDISEAAAAAQLTALRKEMAQAVAGMQFYDRMTQHLTHVRDYLAGTAEQAGSPAGVPPETWEGLNRRLSDRLLSETHRMYLGKNFPANYIASCGAASRAERGAASPGDIDLF